MPGPRRSRARPPRSAWASLVHGHGVRLPAGTGTASVVGPVDGIRPVPKSGDRLRRCSLAQECRLRAARLPARNADRACCPASARSRPSRCCCRSPSGSSRCPAHHARRDLLRRAIWRLDHLDPGEHSGRRPRSSHCIDGHQMAKQGRAGVRSGWLRWARSSPAASAPCSSRCCRRRSRRSPRSSTPGLFLADGARPGDLALVPAHGSVTKAVGMVLGRLCCSAWSAPTSTAG